jgi:hypothetical protein
MNIVLGISQIDIKNILFLETKKNIIIDGHFTKLIYTDDVVTINGIFIAFPIRISGIDRLMNKNSMCFQLSCGNNHEIVKEITEFENRLIEYYKCEYNIQKKVNLMLTNQLSTCKIKLYKEFSNTNKNSGFIPKIVLKISGIWETSDEIGVTYKFIEMYSQ